MSIEKMSLFLGDLMIDLLHVVSISCRCFLKQKRAQTRPDVDAKLRMIATDEDMWLVHNFKRPID